MADIVVSSGSAIAVDTELLRAAATQIDHVAVLITGALRCFERALDTQGRSACGDAISSGWAVVPQVRDGIGAAEDIARAVRSCADLYEAIELTLMQQNSHVCDQDASARLAELLNSSPWMQNRVDQALAMWGASAGAEVYRRLAMSPRGWLLGPVGWGAGMSTLARLKLLVGSMNNGAVGRGTTLHGPLPAVTVAPVGEPRPVTAPQNITETVERVPTTGDTRVVIEKYTGADGEPIAVVYVSGTRPDGGDEEAMSWGSNVPPYLSREHSTATAAVAAALAAAGVAPGSRVALVGYSQGAMVTEMMAASGEYDVAYAQSIGSPVEADVGDDTVHVQLRNEADPINPFRDRALGQTTGSAESVIIEGDSAGGMVMDGEDVTAPHQIDAYLETAAAADMSVDPRLIAVRAALQHLTNGEPGVRYEYSAAAEK